MRRELLCDCNEAGTTDSFREDRHRAMARNDDLRRNIAQRIQDEIAIRHAGMREGQAGLEDTHSAVHQKIEIYATRTPPDLGRTPSHHTLDPLELRKQLRCLHLR